MRSRIISNLILAILVVSTLSVSSCDDYDEIAIEVAGEYDAYVHNGFYEFDVNISIDHDDNVFIEGMFDDYDWDVISSDLDRRNDGSIDFDIPSQLIYNGAELWGDGVYSDGYLQLDYKIDWGNEVVAYKLVGYKY